MNISLQLFNPSMILNSALGELSPGAGSTCGSAGTHDRWVAQTHDNLIQVLFRPWERKDVGVYRGNSHGHYDKTMEGLEKWSLTGVSEYDAFAAYNKQLANTIVSVSGLFQKKYGWSPVLSKELAENALKSAVSSGFGFYMYDPQFSLGEEMLRRRILDKRPIGEIKATEFDVGKVDEEENQYSIGYGLQESILNIAVTYPEALEYLLAKGVYPDMPNAFGKTPLMYAVQANQLETVKILLRAGANPNARTIRPNDTCYYSLSTIGMTPLHYAVRYASPEITRVLLDYGAVPLLKTESGNFSELIRVNGAVQIHRYKNDGDVVAWFDRYNGEKSLERNTNIPIERLDEIKAWLTINAILIPELVNKYILKAEKLYQSNDVNGAYIAIDLALALDSLNIRALGDMSLIAIKIKKLGKSIEASRIVLETSNSNKEISSAWFNQGLACEMAADNSQYGVAYLRFNGNDYCSAGDIYPFYKSIVVNDSVVRRNKLLDKLEKGAHKESGVVKDCAIPGREIKLLFRIVQDPDEKRHKQAQFIYILHSKKESISVEDLKWKVRNYEGNGSGYKTITPILYDNVNLGDYDLTIYKSEEAVSFPHEYYGYTCDYHREKIH